MPNLDITFSYILTYNVVTLSNGNADPGDIVQGSLYVPDLPAGDPCVSESQKSVPDGVTRKKDLPQDGDGKLIALAPWLDDDNCQVRYIAAARDDEANGLLFFIPDGSGGPPPDVASPTWDIFQTDDWKAAMQYPVFAIPGASGSKLMNASVDYSKNITEVPHGNALLKEFAITDYARLFAQASVEEKGEVLPSLWVFLLLILGVMVGVMGFISFIMHWIQLRRRKALRRRVVNGEVDLEALGIKRLTLPQDVLDDMPLYTYSPVVVAAEPDTANKTTTTTTKISETSSKTVSSSSSSGDVKPANPAPLATLPALQQPTCAICLEDFVPKSSETPGTKVRELPCRHIFHPECVDTFLRDTSSLCPLCKKTALPTGYCPKKITNAMVRRERLVRLRGLRAAAAADNATTSPRSMSRVVAWGSAVSALPTYERRSMVSPTVRNTQVESTNPATPPPPDSSPEMPQEQTDVSTATPVGSPESEPPVQPPSNPRRREWARQRAEAMLGRHQAPVDPDAEESRTMPKWRKAMLRIFPSVAR